MKGSVLRDAFISAANNISNHKQKVNALNVFPVPDCLKKAGIDLNRKMLSEIAIHDEAAFTALVEKAKAAL